MSTKKEVQEFLVSRRANVTPEQVGLRRYGEDRRVPDSSSSTPRAQHYYADWRTLRIRREAGPPGQLGRLAE